MVKFLAFNPPGQQQAVIGTVDADERFVTPLVHPITGQAITDFLDVVECWPQYRDKRAVLPALNGSANGSKHTHHPTTYAINDVAFAAPLQGRDVLAVGKNYIEHAKEFNKSGYDSSDKNDIPTFPVIFTKRASSIIAHRQEVYAHPKTTSTLDYEGELGIIIGKSGFNISKVDAMDYVWGYTIINDVTARERQRDHKQFFIGKSLDTFCPIGPYLVPASDIDGSNLELETRVNGEVRQKANTSSLIFDIPTLIECVSMGITVQPGDVIASGTPAGVGFGYDPPRFLKPGDVVDVSISGIGTLSNTISRSDAPLPVVAPVRAKLPLQPTIAVDTSLVRLRNGKYYHVEEKGNAQGPVVAFVHGLGGNLHFFEAAVRQTELEQHCRLLFIDFDGHGITPLSGQHDLTVEGLAEDILLVLEALHVDEESAIALVAHSLGGLVATTFAAKYASRVSKLVLLGPVKSLGEAGVQAMAARADLVRRLGMIAVADTICKAGLSQQTQQSKALSLSFVRQSVMSTNAEGYARACEALKSAQDPQYAAISARTLIISSDEDKTAPPANIKVIADQIRDCAIKELSGVGHWHAVEDSAETSKLLAAFLL
jgi:2-keto-4-pentenoate hydratase/2-oxohepta-3-ene-1,7-dioic acid hydratase in catechol pathway/pimeloyl-ACP methyl ester carboxylesterase